MPDAAAAGYDSTSATALTLRQQGDKAEKPQHHAGGFGGGTGPDGHYPFR